MMRLLETCICFTFLSFSVSEDYSKFLIIISKWPNVFIHLYEGLDHRYGRFIVHLRSFCRAVTSHNASSKTPVAVTPM
jgi:hypothetical protein